ncbi:hypothetical protein EL84_25900 [Paenibacillus sp. VT-400]|nr:hypothetical protein EL84_25900 [Paenibacillus sp. VT-400]
MRKAKRVLDYIRQNGRVSYKEIRDKVLGGNEDELRVILAYLHTKGMITVKHTDQRTLHTSYASITAKGHAEPLFVIEKRLNTLSKFVTHAVTVAITAIVTFVITKLLS